MIDPQVTIICATLNARLATQLTFTSLLRYTSEPVRILVTDNGSTDGTLRLLKNFPGIKIVTANARARAMGLAGRLPHYERLHGATLDWMVAQVDTPYFLTLDSDVEFLASGWLSQLLDLVRSHRLVAVGEFEPADGSYQARLAPHVLLADSQRYRELGVSFRSFVTINDPRESRRWLRRRADFCLDREVMESFPSARFYATGAAFFERLNQAGASWASVPSGLGGKYQHLGHMSWARHTHSSAKGRLRAEHARTQDYLKERLRHLSNEKAHDLELPTSR